MDPLLEPQLRDFAVGLHRPDTPMQTQYVENARIVQGVTCAITYDDPMPDGENYPAAGPLSRSLTLTLRATGESRTHWAKTRTVRPDTVGLERIDGPTQLSGVGDDAVLVAGFRSLVDTAEARIRARVHNVEIEVNTSGMDWAGGPSMPVTDSPSLRTSLSTAAKQLTTAIAGALPQLSPPTTIGWTLQPSAPENDDSPPDTSPITVWDPCSIPESAVTQAGLDPTSKESSPGVHEESARCEWAGQGFSLVLESEARLFRSDIYGHPDWRTGFTPVVVGGRTAVFVDSVSHGDTGCMLAFDVPQGVRWGGTVGIVAMEAWASRPSYSGGMGRPALCDALHRVADVLVPHLPPGRP
ncbi:DUF3558 family protein [Nocardia otitidiscaviarum]|nr:DUF3558 family protein [Nocardia otitidiscaviarum]